jgi:hypothetical protein
MEWIRPQLARVAGGWLVFHLCLLVSVPTALRPTMSAKTVAAECTCDHLGAQVCPMHHPRSSSTRESGGQSCACRSTSDPVAVLIGSLIGPQAVLASSASLFAPVDSSLRAPSFNPHPLESNSIPESPPPRG